MIEAQRKSLESIELEQILRQRNLDVAGDSLRRSIPAAETKP